MVHKEELKSITKIIEEFSRTTWTGSEANTKNKIVEPLLATLGWDIRGNEVVLEYPIKMGSSIAKADYALMLEDKPLVLVETKPFDAELSNDYAHQVISYGRVQDIRWTVLTNGRTLKVFDTKKGTNEKECLIIEINLRKLPLQMNDLKLISRKSILTGDIEAATKRLIAKKRAIRNLKLKKKEVTDEFRKTLLKVAGKEVKNRVEDVARQLAEKTILLFEERAEIEPEYEPPMEVPSVSRKDLASNPPGKVLLCPSKIGGVEFLKKYKAWGFVSTRAGKKHVRYFALYVGRPKSSVLYFGEIESITQPIKSKEDLRKFKGREIRTFPAGKRAIHLKAGTLVEFTDPIPLKDKKKAPRGLRYTTLEKLIQANHFGDL